MWIIQTLHGTFDAIVNSKSTMYHSAHFSILVTILLPMLCSYGTQIMILLSFSYFRVNGKLFEERLHPASFDSEMDAG